MSYTVAHTASTLVVKFTAFGLQEITDESWGIDNLKVEVTPLSEPVPEPGTFLLLGSGVAGMTAWRLRSRGSAHR